jgi:pimeloyl-ACP methyl ester carboxylesterase
MSQAGSSTQVEKPAAPAGAPRLVRVRDGRRIALAEYGALEGSITMFYFHATTSSRLEAWLFDDTARRRGVRVVGLDRPGAGRSDPRPGRRVLDWPADVANVADALGIKRFAVVGQSVGGVHALACAAALPADRLSVAVAINSSVPIAWNPELIVDALPHEKFPMMARFVPLAMRTMLRGWGRLLRPQTLTVKRFATLLTLPAHDRALLSDPVLWQVVASAIREGTRQDRQIAMRELSLVYEKTGWGFDPFSLPTPVVYFLGEEVGGAEFARRIVAGCRAEGARVERFPGGHMGQVASEVTERVIETVVRFA